MSQAKDRGRARRISREADWRDPYAFSEDCFLAARNRSIAVMDGQGKTETVYSLPDELKHLDIHEPRPPRARPREPDVLARTDWSQATGRLVLTDVNRGRNMEGVAPGEITQLLVLETLPKPVNFSGTMEPISMGGTFTLPRILGTVPVEPDGSAYFEAPPMRPLFFVALDSKGLSVKRMQSFVSVMPGETTGCVGCHEHRIEPPRGRADLAAMRRTPSRIRPIANQPDVFESDQQEGFFHHVSTGGTAIVLINQEQGCGVGCTPLLTRLGLSLGRTRATKKLTIRANLIDRLTRPL